MLWVVGATVLVGETIVLAVTVTKTYGWISMFAAARDVTRRRSLLEVLLTDGKRHLLRNTRTSLWPAKTDMCVP